MLILLYFVRFNFAYTYVSESPGIVNYSEKATKSWLKWYYYVDLHASNNFLRRSAGGTAFEFCFLLSLYRPKAIHCNYQLSIIAVFVQYLRQFLIDLNQIYRQVVCHKTRLREFFEFLSSSGFRARRRRDFFCHVVPVTV